jgi:hypothetical protein
VVGSSKTLGQLGRPQKPTTESLARFVATMHLGDKYVFDRSANVPEPMRGDFAMPPPLGTVPEWNHTALAVGARGLGLTWHRHKRALAILVHGRKRWLLHAPFWGLEGAPEPAQREALKRFTRNERGEHFSTAEWIERLYAGERRAMVASAGFDCVQEAGEASRPTRAPTPPCLLACCVLRS